MLKRFLILLICLCLPLTALAANTYIFPDSDKRELTREEVWEWQYEALGYGLNEIFARYGRPFRYGGKYYNYFNAQTWYQENPNYIDDGHAVQKSVEWYNERLIKDVRREMEALGTRNPAGRPLPRVFDDRVHGLLTGFWEQYFQPNQSLKVYSGPGRDYLRGANGKASCSTNGRVYVAGFENGWLLLLYQTNKGSVRVGYAEKSNFRDAIYAPLLSFDYAPAAVSRAVSLTDDPLLSRAALMQLAPGDAVTVLSRYETKGGAWDYVEAVSSGQKARGFVPADSLTPGMTEVFDQ